MKFQRKHGLNNFNSAAHRSWNGMKDRCYNPKSKAFKNYGGRGIKVCDRWLTFDNFLSDMGEPPHGTSIERIDNDGNYEMNNCKWATAKEQNRNKRTNQLVEFSGLNLSISEWSERLNISRNTLDGRLKTGWPVEIALTLPIIHDRTSNFSSITPIQRKHLYEKGSGYNGVIGP